MSQNIPYRDQYRFVMKWLVVMAGLSVVLCGLYIFMSLKPGKVAYYATTTSGVTVPLHSLDEPVVTSKTIIQWASLATRDAFNVGFVNAEQDLQKARPYFTPNGWAAFNKALSKSGLLKTVQTKHVLMSAVVAGAPVILNREVLHGHFTWVIQMPVLVSFSSASEHTQSKLIVTMQVRRVAVLNASQGLQINDFIAKADNF